MTACYIFDVDGTVANNDHRRHFVETPGQTKDWVAFLSDDQLAKDVPFLHMVSLMDTLAREAAILFLTGREERSRQVTVDFLHYHYAARWNQWSFTSVDHRFVNEHLYMRQTGDFRSDEIVKSELLDQVLAKGYAPIMIFEDRNRVVKMWRARGIPCAQVAEGDF